MCEPADNLQLLANEILRLELDISLTDKNLTEIVVGAQGNYLDAERSNLWRNALVRHKRLLQETQKNLSELANKLVELNKRGEA